MGPDDAPLHVLRRTVAFQDVDAAGIVFFPRAFEYAHDAWVDCLRERGVDLVGVLRERVWLAPLVHAESDYREPMRFGDRIDVQIPRVLFGASSMTVHFRLQGAGPRDGVTLCTGKLVSSFIDATTFRKVDVPPAVRAAFVQGGAAGRPPT